MRTLVCRIAVSVALILPRVVFANEVKTPPPAPDVDHPDKIAQGLDIFKRQVRTILVGRCVKCHGGETIESEFDLATREGLMKGGAEGKVVELGQAKMSRLYKLITHAEEPHMPENGARLDEQAIAAIAAWIALGAPYDKPLVEAHEDSIAWTKKRIDDSARQFWSFQPLHDVDPPALSDDPWSQTDIDRFVFAKLREHGLTPNDPTERSKLIRRAYFDLIGLPPTREEVEQFTHDEDPKAFEKLIDRLLENPHHGERWGRHWLDVARFAESHGFEQDYDRPYAFHYRDFVIKALNQDMPYDQFIRWQIAGDEFAPDIPLALMATGFLGAGVLPTQITEKEFETTRYDEMDDMVSTMGTAMLGMTIGCARCHDHKFDPIPQADYYRIVSSFTTTIRSEIDVDFDPTGYQAAKGQFDREHAPLVAALKEYEDGELSEKFAVWLADRSSPLPPEAKWKILDFFEFKSEKGAKMRKLDDGSILVSGEKPNHDKYVFSAETHLRHLTAVRLDALTHHSLVNAGPGRSQNGNFVLADFKVRVQPLGNSKEDPVEVKMVAARATHEQNQGQFSVQSSLDDEYLSGWAVDGGGIGKDQTAVFDFEKPIDYEGGMRLIFEFNFTGHIQQSIGRPRLSVTSDPAPVAVDGELIGKRAGEALALLKSGSDPSQLNEDQRSALRGWFAKQDANWQKVRQSVDRHASHEPQPQIAKVMVTSEGFKPIPNHSEGRGYPYFYKETHFLQRGDTEQKIGVASQGFLQVLMTAPDEEKQWQTDPPDAWRTSYRRRALANWMTDPQLGAGHTLARVVVNRLWQHHMGRGIVGTPNDFGFQGERPTHPELLDWLASRLIQSGWRLKPLHKLIMTSAVYRQSSEFDEADSRIDPDNHWCWRRDPLRLEAEIIRDAMLSVSGQLDRRMFGPGTLDDEMKRRSIYFFVKRSQLIPMMQIFDTPEPLVSVGHRPTTTIAPQALLFMNNRQVRGYARSFAQQLLPAAAESPEDAIAQGYLAAVGRPPSADEIASHVEFLTEHTSSYQAEQKESALERALTDFCQVLFCLNEFIYID